MANALFEALNLELPHFETIDEYIEYIIPKVRLLGEDLTELELITNKSWVQIDDNYDNNDVIVHIFQPKVEFGSIATKEGTPYLRSTNGNLSTGSWSYLPSSNQLMIKHGSAYELYNLVFLNDDFFILLKHGNTYENTKNNTPKYFFMAKEGMAKKHNYQPMEVVEEMYNLHRFNSAYMGTIGFIIILVLFLFLFSVL